LDEAYRCGEPRLALDKKVHLADARGRGRERYVDFVFQPVRGSDGAVTGIFVEGHDVTERVLSAALVREKEVWLSLATEAGGMAVCEIDLASGCIMASPELNRILGLGVDARPALGELRTLFEPGELERLQTWLASPESRRDSLFQAEFRYSRADDGAKRWLLVRGRMTPSQHGSGRFLGVVMDNTDRKESEERLLLLMREVDHRANNLLATAQSIVSLTRAEDVAKFRERVIGRLGALAHSHRLLAQSAWTGASLATLVKDELRPFASAGQVRIDGPEAKLPPAAAQGLAIALHELATNAARHGALTRPNGRVSVSWGPPDADRTVQMTWEERGGEALGPPAQTGLGLNLLRRALGGGIGGGVELDWRPEGLRCRLRIPSL
jgi:PAS domain S-box-containing protein